MLKFYPPFQFIIVDDSACGLEFKAEIVRDCESDEVNDRGSDTERARLLSVLNSNIKSLELKIRCIQE